MRHLVIVLMLCAASETLASDPAAVEAEADTPGAPVRIVLESAASLLAGASLSLATQAVLHRCGIFGCTTLGAFGLLGGAMLGASLAGYGVASAFGREVHFAVPVLGALAGAFPGAALALLFRPTGDVVWLSAYLAPVLFYGFVAAGTVVAVEVFGRARPQQTSNVHMLIVPGLDARTVGLAAVVAF
jgi:hypothetical protein